MATPLSPAFSQWHVDAQYSIVNKATQYNRYNRGQTTIIKRGLSPNTLTRHRATVEIPRYEVVGSMKVHFLPCDQVLVAVNNVQPGYPGYPHNDVINALNLEEPETCPNT
ncbi:conserved hypothetical protein [Pseudomonas sp. 8AS]|uniref:DUF3304 domain-containing protein n=1 Tax=Pseudomonas sp. 8AS TaxID=2653163 RepID=UPI0012EF741A|nr:DUF3304 domain-containing protein [Pseudomonas sp. 8AS]VXB03327.1 conserved hypothetical protein [Pseudomonas sp. 8AS]